MIKETFVKFSDACDEAAMLIEAHYTNVRIHEVRKTMQIIDSVTLDEVYYKGEKVYEVIGVEPAE